MAKMEGTPKVAPSAGRPKASDPKREAKAAPQPDAEAVAPADSTPKNAK
jgi:hypothetical protein